MRIRDIIIVGVGLVLCIIAWSQDGAIQFQRSFQIAIPDTYYHHTLMPRPIVVDPAGLGRPVLIATVRRGELTCYATHYFQHGMQHDYLPLTASSRLDVDVDIIAIGAGYIQPRATEPLIFVVTSSYQLHCIVISDMKQINKKWQASIIPEPFSEPLARRATVTVVPERVYESDVGLVTVWIDAVDEHNIPVHVRAAFHALDGSLRWRHVSYAQREAGDVAHEAAEEYVWTPNDHATQNETATLHNRKNTKSGGNDGINATDPVDHAIKRSAQLDEIDPSNPPSFATSPHFNLTRFSRSRLGMGWRPKVGVKERWTHRMVVEQAMHARMVEQPWTSYREAVMSTLPHHHAHRWDTRLSPHVFYPVKSSGGRVLRTQGRRPEMQGREWHSSTRTARCA